MHVDEVVMAHQWHAPPPRNEIGSLQGYYDARLAAIKAGKESVIANEDHDWGSCHR